MESRQVDIDSVHLDPSNANTHPDVNLAAIKASLARFGQQKPIVVDKNGIVRAGNGTLAAARALGWSRIDVVFTNLEGSEATAYAIADNRTSELSAWDQKALAESLTALQNEDFDLSATGFSADDVDDLIKSLGDQLLGDDDKDKPPPGFALIPGPEYVVIATRDASEWERLKAALNLQTVRRGGAVGGFADKQGTERVITAQRFLEALSPHAGSDSLQGAA